MGVHRDKATFSSVCEVQPTISLQPYEIGEGFVEGRLGVVSRLLHRTIRESAYWKRSGSKISMIPSVLARLTGTMIGIFIPTNHSKEKDSC